MMVGSILWSSEVFFFGIFKINFVMVVVNGGYWFFIEYIEYSIFIYWFYFYFIIIVYVWKIDFIIE